MGNISESFGRQASHTRRRLGWTSTDLATALATHGFEADRTIVSKIENGRRRVSLDEAMTMALVLNVSPLHLLVPRDDGEVEIGGATFKASDVRAWVRGEAPLEGQDPKIYFTESDDESITRRAALDAVIGSHLEKIIESLKEMEG